MNKNTIKGDLNKSISKAVEKYGESISLRAVIQLIPYVGGPIDALLGGKASKIQEKRIRNFLQELNERLQVIELEKEVNADEDFYDLITSVLDGVVKTRSREKQAQFAEIVKNKISGKGDWEEAEMATRLLRELDIIHIRILFAANNAKPICDGPYKGLRLLSIKDDSIYRRDQLKKMEFMNPLYLPDSFPSQSKNSFKMICSELVARGLLDDKGIDTFSLGRDNIVSTELADWFINWINN